MKKRDRVYSFKSYISLNRDSLNQVSGVQPSRGIFLHKKKIAMVL